MSEWTPEEALEKFRAEFNPTENESELAFALLREMDRLPSSAENGGVMPLERALILDEFALIVKACTVRRTST